MEEIVIDTQVRAKLTVHIGSLTEKWFLNLPAKRRNTWEPEINGYILLHSDCLLWHSELLKDGHYLNMEGENNKNYSVLGVFYN